MRPFLIFAGCDIATLGCLRSRKGLHQKPGLQQEQFWDRMG
jgi:hypothetical protein